jgi:ankyrin repeat protein
LVRLLLEAGADLEARQTGDWTPLHAAAERGHSAVVELLLEQGADRTAESVSGKTPLALAQEKGHQAVVALLDPDR